MAYIFDFAVTEGTATAASATPDMPDFDVDDVLVVFFNKDSSPAATETTGLYTNLSTAQHGTAAWGGSWWRRATTSGADTPPTFTFTTETYCIVVVAVRGGHTSTAPTGAVSSDDTTIPWTQNTSFTTGASNALILWGVSTDGGVGPLPYPRVAQTLYGGDASANSMGVSWGFFPTASTETSGANFFGNAADDARIFAVQVPDNGSNTQVDAYVDRGSSGPVFQHMFTGSAVTVNGVTLTLPTTLQLAALGKDFDQVWAFNGTSTYVDETVDSNDSGTADVTYNANVTDAGIYWGADETFDSITIDVGTAGTGTPSATAWEYYNGSSWASLPGFRSQTGNSATDNLAATGLRLLTWTIPSTWAQVSVNSVTKYYIRHRITATPYTATPIIDQAWRDGRPLLADTITATADSGINPYQGAHTITPSQSTTSVHGGGESIFGSAQDWDTGYLLTTYRYTAPRDLIDTGFYRLHRGITFTLYDTSNNYKSWIVDAKDASDAFHSNRKVIAVQPAQTTDTSWAGQGAFSSSLVDTVLLAGTARYGAISAQFNQLMLSGECAIAGGKSTDPMNFIEMCDGFVNGCSLFPIIERAGSSATVWNPIRIGGGDPIHASINLRAFQFPTRASATSKTTQWHVDDNQVGIEFYGKSGDTVKFTNCVFTGETPYYWRFNASASSGATWDFSGTSVAGATVTLQNVMTFSSMTFTSCSQIDASSCTLSSCTISGAPAAGAGLTVNSSSTVTNCTINTTSVSAGNSFVSTTTPEDINNTDFVGSSTTGHAISITSNTGSPFSLVGNTFTGYGANGTTSAAIYNNSGGAVTLNISGGGNTPTYRNGAGASTTVNNTVNLTVTVVDKADNGPIKLAQVAIYKSSDDTQLMNEDTETVDRAVNPFVVGVKYRIVTVGTTDFTAIGASSNTVGVVFTATGIGSGTGTATNGIAFDSSFNYTADTPIYIRVRKSSTGDTKYVPASTTGTIVSTGFSVTITLTQDTNA